MKQEKEFVFRSANFADVEQIFTTDPIAQTHNQRRDHILRAVNAGECHLATENGVLGYAVLEYSFYGYGFLSLLEIRPDRRRQGVGSAFLCYLETFCTKDKLFTSTNESNLPMQALLEKLGYLPSGIIYGLDEGDPELVFRKDLR